MALYPGRWLTLATIDFGSGPFTGLQTLLLVIAGYFGPLNLGIRLEKTDNTSTLFDLRLIVLPVDLPMISSTLNYNTKCYKKI